MGEVRETNVEATWVARGGSQHWGGPRERARAAKSPAT